MTDNSSKVHKMGETFSISMVRCNRDEDGNITTLPIDAENSRCLFYSKNQLLRFSFVAGIGFTSGIAFVLLMIFLACSVIAKFYTW